MIDSNCKNLVSIFCLAYNHEKFISQTLESFLMQKTNFEYEIVIGEDCSTDSTRNIIDQYANKHSNIKIITDNKNVGPIENMKRTLKACTGKYIALCEGDDFWVDSYKLQKQVDFLEANPYYMVAYHDAVIIDETGKIVSKSKLQSKYKKDAAPVDLQRGHTILFLTMMFRNVIDLPPELDNVIGCDAFLGVLFGQHGKGKYMPEVQPAAYRVHSGGIFSQKNEIYQIYHYTNTRAWIAKYLKRTGDTDNYIYYRELFIKLVNLQSKSYCSKQELTDNYAKLLTNHIDLFEKEELQTFLANNLKTDYLYNNVFSFWIRNLKLKFIQKYKIFMKKSLDE